MGRISEALTVKFVESKKREPGMYCDGNGLYLRVAVGGSRQWMFRYVAPDPSHKRGYRLRDMGLGSIDDLSLAQAREEARKARLLRRDGTDPIADKAMRKAARIAAQAKMRTFQQCAEGYIKDNEKEWNSAKHRREWETTLAKYVFPTLGLLPVETIETPHVLDVVKPLWNRVPTTGKRVQERIEGVLGWATVHHYRTGDNPAKWSGLLEHALPALSELVEVKHHPALPYEQVGIFMSKLRQETSAAARCLEFLILTAMRVSAVRMATWDEIDFEAHVWTAPGRRMKRKKKNISKGHRIPLSDAAMTVLEAMRAIRHSDYIFPGIRGGRPVGETTLRRLVNRLAPDIEITNHGMRSTFKDWAADCTSFANEVSEMAIAHSIKNQSEAAYRRRDLFQKRVQLMQAWADYCGGLATDDKVVSIAAHR